MVRSRGRYGRYGVPDFFLLDCVLCMFLIGAGLAQVKVLEESTFGFRINFRGNGEKRPITFCVC
jgi:hypothetical protein